MIIALKKRIKHFLKMLQFRKDKKQFEELNDNRFPLLTAEIRPLLNDKTSTTVFDAHYVYHPAWAIRIVKRINPKVHIDISSSLHFCANLSAFIPVHFYDYRPAILNLSQLKTSHANLTNLHFENDSIESLSCMHTVEHIGLGRYGDLIDPKGDLKAIAELKRVCAIGGNLLFVTPIGKPRLQFNAHRIYSPQMIMEYFDGFELIEFAYVSDNQEFIHSTNPSDARHQSYACGCFWFKKLK